jgi:hypothetical protein
MASMALFSSPENQFSFSKFSVTSNLYGTYIKHKALNIDKNKN